MGSRRVSWGLGARLSGAVVLAGHPRCAKAETADLPGPTAASLRPAPSERAQSSPSPSARPVYGSIPPQVGRWAPSDFQLTRSRVERCGSWKRVARREGFWGLLTQAPGPAGGGERNELHVCPSGRARRPGSGVCACSLRGFQNRHGPPPPLLAARGLSVAVGLGILEGCFVLGSPRFFPLPGLSQMGFGVWLLMQSAGG